MPRPLPENIVIRPANKRAEPPYSSGLQGILEKFNPGDFGPDMTRVVDLVKESGATPLDIFRLLFTDQGWRSYLVAEDTNTGEVVACAQLGRIQIGGYLYLTDDLQIRNLYVLPEYRNMGIGNNLVHGLLTRLDESSRAWAFAEKDSPAFYFFFASGFVGINYQEAGQVFPFVLWVLLWPFHGRNLAVPGTIFFAAEGRGGPDAVNPAG